MAFDFLAAHGGVLGARVAEEMGVLELGGGDLVGFDGKVELLGDEEGLLGDLVPGGGLAAVAEVIDAAGGALVGEVLPGVDEVVGVSGE